MMGAGGIALRALVDEPSLHLRALVSHPQQGQIRWAATSELADPTPFLEGGELLLTTGLAAADWAQEWDGYVERLQRRGVVAIGFGVGLSHPSVPQRLIEACRRQQVSLLEVPHATTFVAISRRTAQLLEQHEQARTRQAVAAQQRLTASAAREDESELLRVLAEALGGGAQILDADGVPIERATGSAVPDPESVAILVQRMRPQGLHAAASAAGPHGTTVVHPLGHAPRPQSYLAVWTPGPLDHAARGTVTTAAALLSLVDTSIRARRHTYQRLVAVALERLFEGDVRAAEVLLEATAGDHEPALSLPPRIRVLLASGTSAQVEDAVRFVHSGATGGKVHALGALRGDRLCVVAAPRDARALAPQLAERGLQVGVGSLQVVAQAPRSLDSAANALVATSPAAPVVRWDDLVGQGVLALVGPRAAHRFAQSFLGSVAEDEELLETLRSYLSHHGSRGAVALDLGIHRNTVRNRLATIEQALGRNLADPSARVDAWVALQSL